MTWTELGLDPGPSLATLETGILHHAADLDSLADDVLAVTAAAYQRTAIGATRTRLESSATLASSLALTGGSGLRAAMSQRLAAIEAAEKLGDPGLTARVIGNFDVPAIWTRPDDPATAARIVAAAERALPALPAGHDPLRARLLATIALEGRWSPCSPAGTVPCGPRRPRRTRQPPRTATVRPPPCWNIPACQVSHVGSCRWHCCACGSGGRNPSASPAIPIGALTTKRRLSTAEPPALKADGGRGGRGAPCAEGGVERGGERDTRVLTA